MYRGPAALAGSGGGLVAVGKVVGADDRSTIALHLPGKWVEYPSGLPTLNYLASNLLVLRYEWLTELPLQPPPRMLARAMQVEGIADCVRRGA